MAVRGISGDAHFFEESVNMERIKKLLDNKTGSAGVSEKLQAMKTLLAMISKGEDVSLFFADVVKNVIVNSVEVKKMVYMYLVHYADANAQCRELALLSINSFQKDLADPNQLIRALALRVMTSIRVRDIIQIQLIAIRKCAGDSSPYVRKCAANALSKIHLMDSTDQKEVLAEIISILLADSSTMVLGSAVQALNEICPDRMDLLHPAFRKLCHLLADIDEWGQAVVIHVLTRYCREQFQSPKQEEAKQANAVKELFPKRKVKKGFYSDEEEDTSSSSRKPASNPFLLGSSSNVTKEHVPSIGSVFRSNDVASGIGGGEELDEDHRLLLRSSIPLLKSRNSAVVLAVSTLHYYCGTQSMATCTLLGKSLVRIMRNQREIQFVVLSVIASMATARPDMFLPFLQDFFVRATDPSYCRQLKLNILTALVTEETVATILREFQAYVRHVDKGFVTMTVRALGRVADAMPSVSEKCLKGLMRLVRSVHEQVVAESVVVIRQLLQQQAASVASAANTKVVRSLAAMMVSGRVSSPSARASIVWMLGEFAAEEAVSRETLRCMSSNFPEEESEVKMQLLNLAVKLALKNSGNTNVQLCLQYIVELSKFDLDYDIRDRARLVRAALNQSTLNPHTIFLCKKPAPLIGCNEQTKTKFTLGSLSEIVHHSVTGYLPLPSWRVERADKRLRDATAELPSRDTSSRNNASKSSKSKGKNTGGFYSDSSDDSDDDDDDSDDSEEYDEDESEEESDEEEESEEESDEESEEEESEEESDEESEESEPARPASRKKTVSGSKGLYSSPARATKKQTQQPAAPQQPLNNNLLDPFDFLTSSTGGNSHINSSSMLADLSNLTMSVSVPSNRSVLLAASDGDGLQIEYTYLRTPSMHSPHMNVVQCYIMNQSTTPIARIRVNLEASSKHGAVIPFPEVPVVYPGSSSMVQLHVDFHGRMEGVPLEIQSGHDDDVGYKGVLQPTIGELLHPFHINMDQFVQLWSSYTPLVRETRFFLSSTLNDLIKQLTYALNLSHINAHQLQMMNVQAPTPFQFVGKLRTDKEVWMLATMEVNFTAGIVRIQVAKTQASLADALLDAIVDTVSQ